MPPPTDGDRESRSLRGGPIAMLKEQVVVNDAVTVVRRFLEGLHRLDPEAMYAEVADDFVFEMPLAPEGLPKRVEGKSEFISLFGPMAAGLWKEIEFPTLEVRGEVDPERAIAEYTSQGTFGNGKSYANTYVMLCRVQDGKIVHSAEFFDPIALLAGLSPPQPGRHARRAQARHQRRATQRREVGGR